MSDADLLRRLTVLEALGERLKTRESSVAAAVLDEQDPAAGVGSVTLTPAGSYHSLWIVWTGRGDTAALAVSLFLRFNGDSGANYDYSLNEVASSANTPVTTTAASGVRCGAMAAASAAAGLAGSGDIVIPHYAGTTLQKHIRYNCAFRTGTTAADIVMEDGGGNWRNTAAITSIVVVPNTGNFAAGCRFTLYGLP